MGSITHHLSVKQGGHFVCLSVFPLVFVDLIWYFKPKNTNVIVEDYIDIVKPGLFFFLSAVTEQLNSPIIYTLVTPLSELPATSRLLIFFAAMRDP